MFSGPGPFVCFHSFKPLEACDKMMNRVRCIAVKLPISMSPCILLMSNNSLTDHLNNLLMIMTIIVGTCGHIMLLWMDKFCSKMCPNLTCKILTPCQHANTKLWYKNKNSGEIF